eukprot:1497333-Pleurochrysis_carterae.AAC.1
MQSALKSSSALSRRQRRLQRSQLRRHPLSKARQLDIISYLYNVLTARDWQVSDLVEALDAVDLLAHIVNHRRLDELKLEYFKVRMRE